MRETHDGRSYLIPRRRGVETMRLMLLSKELHSPRQWTVTRGLRSGRIVRIGVDADSPTDAARVADEVVYALSWDGRGASPEQWAIGYTDIGYVRS